MNLKLMLLQTNENRYKPAFVVLLFRRNSKKLKLYRNTIIYLISLLLTKCVIIKDLPRVTSTLYQLITL